jgi:hypothetical protein
VKFTRTQKSVVNDVTLTTFLTEKRVVARLFFVRPLPCMINSTGYTFLVKRIDSTWIYGKSDAYMINSTGYTFLVKRIDLEASKLVCARYRSCLSEQI